VKETLKGVKANALLRLGNFKCQMLGIFGHTLQGMFD